MNIYLYLETTYNYDVCRKEYIMKKFIPVKTEKEVISIRLESELLKTVDAAAEQAEISRNEFINQSIQFALEHLSYEER